MPITSSPPTRHTMHRPPSRAQRTGGTFVAATRGGGGAPAQRSVQVTPSQARGGRRLALDFTVRLHEPTDVAVAGPAGAGPEAHGLRSGHGRSSEHPTCRRGPSPTVAPRYTGTGLGDGGGGGWGD